MIFVAGAALMYFYVRRKNAAAKVENDISLLSRPAFGSAVTMETGSGTATPMGHKFEYETTHAAPHLRHNYHSPTLPSYSGALSPPADSDDSPKAYVSNVLHLDVLRVKKLNVYSC